VVRHGNTVPERSGVALSFCSHHISVALAQDAKQAVFWHRKAAEQGYALGQLALGLSYYEGKGLVQDYTQAYVWLSVAAANGATSAAKLRDITAKKLTQSQLKEAQKLAGRYFEIYQPRSLF